MAEYHHVNRVGDVGEAFLTIKDTPVYFSEDWNAGIGGGLWSTGLALAKYFERHADDVANNLKRLASVKYSSQRRNRSVENDNGDGRGISALELGSGNGFLSVCLLAVAAHRVIPLDELVVTDMADHLDLMARTLNANAHVWDRLTVLRAGNDGANEEYDGRLSETRPDDNQQQPSATRVFVTEHMWESLSQKPHSCNRTKSVTMTDTQPVFFDLLTEAGFRYEKLADHLLEREFRGSNFGIIAIQKQ
ncbi:hypothetical protein ACHAW5_010622 [Stephanodiscus triporus]|uniref:Calmodulin-lysine N-methyltransferase n=1 Tax=Stephanodiscus triporus TaxID=2934178 RepID=A0ABD3P607_9STRA